MKKYDGLPAPSCWRQRAEEYLRLAKENQDAAAATALLAVASAYAKAANEFGEAEAPQGPSYRLRPSE
jgi:hypothetical protein